MRGDLDPLLMISVFIVWQMLCSSSTEPSVMRYICGSALWTLDSNAIALNRETNNSMNNKTKGYYMTRQLPAQDIRNVIPHSKDA